jgi:hypothetical protein
MVSQGFSLVSMGANANEPAAAGMYLQLATYCMLYMSSSVLTCCVSMHCMQKNMKERTAALVQALEKRLAQLEKAEPASGAA